MEGRRYGASATGSKTYKEHLDWAQQFALFLAALTILATSSLAAPLKLTPAADLLEQVVAITEDANGELYVVQLSGAIYRIDAELPAEGEGEGEGEPPFHSADQNQDEKVNLSELLRVIQFHNIGGYGRCEDGEDGFCPGV